MRLTSRFFMAAASVLAMGAMMSCEDNCNNCSCDSYKVDYVSAPDSINVALSELYTEQTIVVRGSGLSSTSEVYLYNSAGDQYFLVPLNTTLVTDNDIIITLKSDADAIATDQLVLRNQSGCEFRVAIAKPVPTPTIKQFYSEFVPEGDTLRIAGAGFIDKPDDPLSVWFYSDSGDSIPAPDFKVANNNNELLVKVPAGVGASQPVGVKNSHGTSISKMLFRDKRNVFLDFTNTLAGDQHGALDSFSNTFSQAIMEGDYAIEHNKMLSLFGGTLPKSCEGEGDYYAAITRSGGFDFVNEQMIYLTQAQSGFEQKNLMGVFAGTPLDNMVLKFEVYVPKFAPVAAFFSLTFSAYGSELSARECNKLYPGAMYNQYIRSLTSFSGYNDGYNAETNTFTCAQNSGTAAAWFHPGEFSTLDIDNGIAEATSGFYTDHGWMTVAIPLTREYFHYNVQEKSITTAEVYVACGTLKEFDLNNMLFFNEDTQFQKAINSGLGTCFFMGCDNFRIVPEDGNGVRFSKYKGATPGSKYPY